MGLTALKECLLNPTLALTSVDLMYNRIGGLLVDTSVVFVFSSSYALNEVFLTSILIGEAGAKILIEAVNPENTKIKEFLVDLTLPMPIFEQLFRKGGGKAKGKGKGKKGKGKK